MTEERQDRESRPSPEALLKQASQEAQGRGRLKIFLGAAPGVGKTYEMLSQARQRRLDGVDAVIGVVETHGRIETDLLTKGFETVPKKRILYKGQVLAEMDLDAILQRRHRTGFVVPALAWLHDLRPWVNERLMALGTLPFFQQAPASALWQELRGNDSAAWIAAFRAWRWITLLEWARTHDVRFS